MSGKFFLFATLLASLAMASLPAAAADRTWVCPSATTGDWFEVANWNGGGTYPGAGDTALITNGYCLLTNSTTNLAAFTLTNATLIFSNWDTCLNATNVAIWNKGTVTVANAFATNQMSNRVYIVCSNLTVGQGGSIRVAGRGFDIKQGPGAGGSYCGGGYGGRGGGAAGGAVYGLTNAPEHPGSGGEQAGAGGGAVRIIADSGTVRVDGLIDANGAAGGRGGGSGGSIFIEGRVFEGNGVLQADGGNTTSGYADGAGGGGRIAVVYDPAAQLAVSPKPAAVFSTRGGAAPGGYPGALGTLYFSDTAIFAPVVNMSANLSFESATNWQADALTISNGYTALPPGFALAVSNDLAVVAGGRFFMTNAGGLRVDGNLALNTGQLYYAFADGNATSLVIGGNFVMTNGASLYLYAGQTNEASAPYGGLFDLAGRAFFIPTNNNVYLYSHPTNGGSIKIRVGSLTVAAGGQINADSKGFLPGYGAGQSSSSQCGGGYGGRGGERPGYTAPGNPYGSTNAPIDPGSGGGTLGYGGCTAGGGLVWVEGDGAMRVDGIISADGGTVGASTYAGAGSGGGIFLSGNTFAGSGRISASGGSATYAGGGGGGRVAVIFDPTAQAAVDPKPAVVFSVAGGASSGNPSSLGTLFFTDTSVCAPVINMSGCLFFGAETNVSFAALTISNGCAAFPPNIFLTVSNDLAVISGGRLLLTNTTAAGGLGVGGDVYVVSGQLHYAFAAGVPETMNIGGGLTLSNTSRLCLYAGQTNASTTNYGGLLNLAGKTLVVPSNCAIYPYSHPTNGGSIKMAVGGLEVAAGGQINADGLGFASGYGPGRGASGQYAGGSGYGGKGAGLSGQLTGGNPYGSSNAPIDPGSGGSDGWGTYGAAGGGLIWIEADWDVAINGTLTANGVTASGGAGSGGGIFITCGGMFGGGADGILRANAGNGAAGGGGGRIAVWYAVPTGRMHQRVFTGESAILRRVDAASNPTGVGFAGAVSAAKGTGGSPAAEDGTLRFLTVNYKGTKLTVP